MEMLNHEPIHWWRTSFGEKEIASVVSAMENECVSQGRITQQFENQLAEFLEVEHVVAVSSGSSALLIALMAIGIKPGDEVIVPDRTWIATAHAVHMLGAKAVIVDVEKERPIIDVAEVEKAITPQTKAIIPVHMNGRSANMKHLQKIATQYKLHLIEDAAQAFSSKNNAGYLGTQSDIGCFSLSVAKIIATGQGGFAVTNNADLAHKLRAIRTHGVENVTDPTSWVMPGFNFRYTDIQAAIGIEQLKKVMQRREHLIDIYLEYEKGLNSSPFGLIPVDISIGEVPVYAEFLLDDRKSWIDKLAAYDIETRPFYPCLDKAKYLSKNGTCNNAQQYEVKGIYLPGGPTQSIDNVRRVIDVITSF